MKRVLLAAVAVTIALGGALAVRNAVATRKPAALPIIIRVELTQGRVDEVRRTVEISMSNDGPAPVDVRKVELRAPSFKGAGPVAVDAPLPAGGLRVDVPVSYGSGDCAGDDLAPHSAASSVALGVRTQDGRTRDVVLPLASPDPLLDKLLADDCRQDYLDRRATFGFGPWTRLPHDRLGGTVVVKRVGLDNTVTLRNFSGSILLEVLPAPLGERTAEPYGTLKPGEDVLRIPITVDGDRCTPHVMAEIKKPYVFPAFVSIDGSAPLYTELRVTDADRAAFKPIIDACAARQEHA